MAKKKGKKDVDKEDMTEDWCFFCKEGGKLLICDHGDCLKTYHAECIGKDNSFIESGSSLTCGRHFCFICNKRSKYCCYCCPKAVCQRCLENSEFQYVKGKKGFCSHCLKLALLAEENKDVDSDGEKVDFRDLQTYEGLFLEYWQIIKKQEGLSLEHLLSADAQLRKRNSMSVSDPEVSNTIDEETDLTSDYEDDDGVEKQKPVLKKKRSKKKRYKEQKIMKKMDVKSTKREFIGWGSKSLIHFLESIDEDTSKKLSQFEVSAIVNGYINKNKLFDPNKKKKIMCDERLKCLLGKKRLSRNRIYDMLEPHFLENVQLSDEDNPGHISENQALLVPCKKQRTMNTCKKSVEKVVTTDVLRSSLAAIVPENLRLVYLKRSLVQELLKQPEEFEKKVIGSFVRVKSDPYDYLQRNSHQLVQVRGIKKTSVAENITEIHFEVSNMHKNMSISLLSDDNFTEEECEDLRKRVKDGMLGNPTVEELEEKAKSLHEDITKHWIIRELDLLQHKIDQANEKGWRRELAEYLERRQLLQTSAEQSRLLQQIPEVVASLAEPEPMADGATNEYVGDESFPVPISPESYEVLENQCGSIKVSSVVAKKLQFQDTFQTEQSPEKELNPKIVGNQAVSPPQVIELSINGDDIGTATIKEELVVEEEHSMERSLQQDLSRKQQQSQVRFSTEQKLEKDSKPRIVENHKVSQPQLIELSSDSDDMGAATIKEEKDEQVVAKEKPRTEQNYSMQRDLSPKGGKLQSQVRVQTEEKPERDLKPRIVRNQQASPPNLIELSSDDEDDLNTRAPTVKEEIKDEEWVVTSKMETEDDDKHVWYCVGPYGDQNGPLSLSLLRRWTEMSEYALKCKVWREGQSRESAIPLGDAISRFSSQK